MSKLTLVEQWRLIEAIAFDPRTTAAADVAVAVYLCNSMSKDGVIRHRGHNRIAEATGLSVSSTFRATDRLIERGYFVVEKEGGGVAATTYRPICRVPVADHSVADDTNPMSGMTGPPCQERQGPPVTNDGPPLSSVIDDSCVPSRISSCVSPSESGRRARRSAVPSDWMPDDQVDRTHALKKGLDDARIDREAEKFRDWHQREGRTVANLHAAWRMWIAKSVEFDSKVVPLRRAPASVQEAGDLARQFLRTGVTQ